MYREVIHVKHQLNKEWVVKKEIVYTAVGLKVKWFVLCSVVLDFYVLRGVIVHRLSLMVSPILMDTVISKCNIHF